MSNNINLLTKLDNILNANTTTITSMFNDQIESVRKLKLECIKEELEYISENQYSIAEDKSEVSVCDSVERRCVRRRFTNTEQIEDGRGRPSYIVMRYAIKTVHLVKFIGDCRLDYMHIPDEILKNLSTPIMPPINDKKVYIMKILLLAVNGASNIVTPRLKKSQSWRWSLVCGCLSSAFVVISAVYLLRMCISHQWRLASVCSAVILAMISTSIFEWARFVELEKIRREYIVWKDSNKEKYIDYYNKYNVNAHVKSVVCIGASMLFLALICLATVELSYDGTESIV